MLILIVLKIIIFLKLFKFKIVLLETMIHNVFNNMEIQGLYLKLQQTYTKTLINCRLTYIAERMLKCSLQKKARVSKYKVIHTKGINCYFIAAESIDHRNGLLINPHGESVQKRVHQHQQYYHRKNVFLLNCTEIYTVNLNLLQ